MIARLTQLQAQVSSRQGHHGQRLGQPPHRAHGLQQEAALPYTSLSPSPSPPARPRAAPSLYTAGGTTSPSPPPPHHRRPLSPLTHWPDAAANTAWPAGPEGRAAGGSKQRAGGGSTSPSSSPLHHMGAATAATGMLGPSGLARVQVGGRALRHGGGALSHTSLGTSPEGRRRGLGVVVPLPDLFPRSPSPGAGRYSPPSPQPGAGSMGGGSLARGRYSPSLGQRRRGWSAGSEGRGGGGTSQVSHQTTGVSSTRPTAGAVRARPDPDLDPDPDPHAAAGTTSVGAAARHATAGAIA